MGSSWLQLLLERWFVAILVEEVGGLYPGVESLLA